MQNYISFKNQQEIDAVTEQQPGIVSVGFDDWAGDNIKSIPDNFFSFFPGLTLVVFNMDIEQLPASLYKSTSLKKIVLSSTKFKSFDNDIAALQQLEEIDCHYRNKQINWAKEFPKLAKLPLIKHFELKNLRGTVFPEELVQMQQLESIKIDAEVFKKCDHRSIIATIAKMKQLKKVVFNSGYKERLTINDDLLALDFLEELQFENHYPSEELAPVLALFKKTKLTIPFQRKKSGRYDYNSDTVAVFRDLVSGDNYNNTQLQILFCCWLLNFHSMRQLVPNVLLQQPSPSYTIALVGKTKRDRPKELAQLLSTTNISLAKNNAADADLLVILSTAGFEEVKEILNTGKPFIVEDQLNEYISGLGQHYLLDTENETLNEELIRLLASNQPENYLLAFQIIESGGANKTIQSLLAAIYLAHPDKKIQKEVTRLYKKYCTVAYQEFADKNLVGMSLRKSGNSKAAFKIFSNHADINRMEFILMYHKIAGDNQVIKDVDRNHLFLKEQDITSIPPIFKYFDHFSILNLEKNPQFNVQASLAALEQAMNLRELNLSGNHIDIPDISTIQSLRILNIPFNQLYNGGTWLQHMNLQQLDMEGCRIDEWSWMGKLKNLRVLNISGNTMNGLPDELFHLPVNSLTARNCKLKHIDERLNTMSALQSVDLGNNQLTEFRSFLLRFTSVSLRSNEIAVFETEKYAQELSAEGLPISHLDLANNKLSNFHLQGLPLHSLKELDISGNQLTSLDESVFTNSSLRIFEANNNKIEIIPAAATRNYYERFWIEKNRLKELQESLNAFKVGNFNLKNNAIEFVHPSFFSIHQGYDRANWKIDGNPVCKTAGFNDYSFRYPGRK